ncbi:hypothetical protein DSM104299_05750 [Baekduia alba]|uniref:hypothetical protein n=1 Tax=Baekduia alba TaxID=2997333 RepID=UPI0023419179|nr:hypothetical protein [Baekduia alba]WCB96980.1 hypothetical protein DSM104299_05750 [Baekduia alba]
MATAQGLTVTLCGSGRGAAASAAFSRTRADVRSRRWAVALLAPPAIFVAMVALLARNPDAAQLVLQIATVGVPALAAFATKDLSRRGWPAIVTGLLAAALLWSDELVGQVAVLALLVLSCVAIGSLMPRLGHPTALAAGAATLALTDVILVVLGPVGAAADALDSVRLGHLPSFGEAVVGNVHMGYGDLAIAGIAGAIAARSPGGASRVGFLTLVLFLAEAALLAGPKAYPATLPVVAALALDALWRLRAPARTTRPAPEPQPAG